ncbi:MAG: lysylphosphatidylglycerol synthase domain-containing protein [Planctomycetota bacterium]
MNVSDTPRQRLNARRLIGFVAGLILLGLAIGFALRGVELSVLGQTSVLEFTVLAGLVGLNLLLTSLLFWGVTRPFAPVPAVGWRIMTSLLAVSGVLNYIPMIRAGLWGRAAYLKKFHSLAVKDSLLILGVVLGLAVSVLGTVCLVLLLLPGETGWWACGGALAVQTFMSVSVWGKALRRPAVGAWMWVPLRTFDLAAAAARLWLAFGIVGVELTWADAVLLASATLVVKLVGLTPNGLGLSEWVVAALSAAMMPIEAATAAAAALVDRTVEVGVMLLAGAVGAWLLKRETNRRAVPGADEQG